MDVLVLLHERAGEVVSAEQILARVWGGAVVSDHSVAVVVSDLRKALGDSSRTPRFIDTVPKRGYRLRAEAVERAEAAGGGGGGIRRPRLVVGLAGGLALLVAGGAALLPRPGGPPAPRAGLDRFTEEKYFQARQLWSRREADAALQARRLLEEVLAVREAFAPAHAALADLYAHKTGEYLGVPPLESFRAAQRHLDRALALDPGLPEPWVSQALLDFYRDRQPKKALASLDRALGLEPRLALAWQTRAMVLSATGAHAASLAAIERAGQLDPLSDSIGWDRVWFLYLAARYDAAFEALEQASRRSPRNLFYEALIEEGRGRRRRALEVWLERFARRGVTLSDPAAIRSRAERSLPESYALLLRQLERAAPAEEASGALLAMWRQLAGDSEGAIAALEAAPRESEMWIRAWLHELPVLRPLRGRPEMQALVAREGIAGIDPR